jgi:hypothetical protein
MTHSPPGKYKARCVPKSPNPSVFTNKACFQVLFSRWKVQGGLWADHQIGGGLRASPIRHGPFRMGRSASGPRRDSPVAQVFNLCLSIVAASPARAIVGFESRPRVPRGWPSR